MPVVSHRALDTSGATALSPQEIVKLRALRAAFHIALARASGAATFTASACPPLTCRYCGGYRTPFIGSRLDGHERCIVPLSFMSFLLDVLETSAIPLADIAAVLGVTTKTIRVWYRVAIDDRAGTYKPARPRAVRTAVPSSRPDRRRPLVHDELLLRRARRAVLKGSPNADHSDEPHRLRRVSAEYDRLRAEAGLPALVVNEPPPGWSVEEDRREELLAWSEHVAMRKVA